jgi:hypothetical protein
MKIGTASQGASTLRIRHTSKLLTIQIGNLFNTMSVIEKSPEVLHCQHQVSKYENIHYQRDLTVHVKLFLQLHFTTN